MTHGDAPTPNAGISVIVPCYNLAEYLPAALDSALAQTRPVSEIIVVDDGSTDASFEVAASYGPPVRVLRQENRGVSAARNRAIDEASGEWLAFLDADDVWSPTYLERQLAAVDGPEVVCVFSDFYLFGEDREKTFVEGPDHACGPDYQVTMLCAYSVLISMALVRTSGLGGLRFPVGVSDSEDMIFFLELRDRGRFVHVPEPLVGYRIRSDSAVRDTGHELRSVRTRFDYMREHRERYTEEEQLTIRRHLARALVQGHGRALYRDRDPAMARSYRELYAEVRPPDFAVPPEFRRRLWPRWMYRVRDAIHRFAGV